MPRLPPVPISPQTRWRARFWPGVIDSVVTFFQSHSSSSATSWARPVSVPCPISERAMRITHVSSAFTTTHAEISVPAAAVPAASAARDPSGVRTPSARLPPATAVLTRKARRDSAMSGPLLTGGDVHGCSDALICPAPADIGHGVVDVLVGRRGVSRQQGRGGHDLPGLAIATLWHVQCRPGLLHRVRTGRRQTFDRDDLVGGFHAPDGDRAGARERAVDVHRAGAALRDAAAVLGAGQAHLLADHPQERRVGFHLHVTRPAIDVQLRHALPPLAVRVALTLPDARRGAKELWLLIAGEAACVPGPSRSPCRSPAAARRFRAARRATSLPAAPSWARGPRESSGRGRRRCSRDRCCG